MSHEAIYQALYIQGRGALNGEVVACLQSGVARVPNTDPHTSKAFATPDTMISERPTEVEDPRYLLTGSQAMQTRMKRIEHH